MTQEYPSLELGKSQTYASLFSTIRCKKRNCKTPRDVQLSYTPLGIFNVRARPTPDPQSIANLSCVLDVSIDGVAPIAQSTPHTSFVEPSDPVALASLSGRRNLVRLRVLGSGSAASPPVTPVARRRPTPIVYSSPPSLGRLVIDEGSTAGASTNATVVVPASSHDFLDISWLDEQQTRLQPPPPPPGSGQ